MRVSAAKPFAATGPVPARAGIGLRSAHHDELQGARPRVGFLEVHTENAFHAAGRTVTALERLRPDYPLSLHGVGLGLGSASPLDRAHLDRVAAAVRRFEPMLVSEHACWGHADGEHFNDLLPLPYTEEAVAVLADRIGVVQDVLQRPILIENLSQYLRFKHSTLSEAEFLTAVVERSGCGLLVDVNNLYVNQVNLGACARTAIESLPAAAVGEIHLAGHLRKTIDGTELLIDDHGSRVCDEVWSLYEHALAVFGPRPTLIEWDTAVPALSVLLEEAEQASRRLERPHADAA